MRKAPVAQSILTAAALLLASWALSAEPQISVFDFSAPGPQQQGEYQTSAGAELSGGFGILSISDPEWWDGAWAYRLPLEIVSAGDLTDAAFDLILDPAGPFLFDNADVSGLDLVMVAASGGALSPWWMQRFSRIEREGTLRLVADSLPSGSSGFYLYFGGDVREDDRDAVFTYADGGPYLVFGDEVAAAAAGLVLMSFSDGNEVSAPGFSGTLNRGETATVPAGSASAPHDAVTATRPLFAVYDGSSGDAAAPLRLAGTLFVLPTPRYEDRFTVISTGPEARATISDSTGDLDVFAVPAAGSIMRMVDIATDTVRITSDVPVVVFRTSMDSVSGNYYDSVVIPPAAADITGGCAGTCMVSAAEDGTEGMVYMNGVLEETFSLDAFGRYTITATGSQGSGPAVRIVATRPVMAVTYGDGDGGEMAAFLATRWLGREFMIPVDCQYVLAAAVNPSTTCSLEYGGAPHEQTSDTIAPPYPKKLFWGSATNGANVPAPAVLTCDKPVWAMAERTTGDDEFNLWPMIFFRDGQPDLEVSFASSYETRLSRGVEWIVTPVLVPANGVLAWTGFSAGGSTETPEGTSLLYQVSNDGGLRWYVYDPRGGWREASGTGDGSDASDADVGMAMLEVLDGELAVRVLMSSPEGVLTPRIDEITVGFDAIGDVSTFHFVGLPATWYEGLPLVLRIRALDEDGNLVVRFLGPVTVTTDLAAVTLDPAASPEFSGGEVSYSAVFQGSGTVMLTASSGDVSTTAGPVSVVASSEFAASMVKVSGDNQFGVAGHALAEPLAVRVLDDDGEGIADAAVTWEVSEGGGFVSASPVATDADGYGVVWWILGAEPGPNRVTVSAGDIEGSPAEFVARGDPPDITDDGDGDGGCGCAVVR